MRKPARRILFIALILTGVGSVGAGEEGSTLDTRLYRVGALTAGNPDFVPHAASLVDTWMVSDEENPLFGGESEESRLPFGPVDLIVELVKAGVSPAFWDEVENAGVVTIHGPDLLLVRATPAVHAELAQFLTSLEQRALTTWTIDVQAVRLPESVARGRLRLGDDELAALSAAGALGPALRLQALPGQRVFAFDGAERAFLQDGDVEVAQEAMLIDPIVGVLCVGMAAGARAIPSHGGGSVTLAVEARLSEPTAPRHQSDKRGWHYELPGVLETDVKAAVNVPVGTWAILDGQAGGGDPPGWAFLARAAPTAPPAGARSKSILLPDLPTRDPGSEVAMRLFDVGDLLLSKAHRRGPCSDLVPSNFVPPEPPEIPEPAPALSLVALADLLRDTVDPHGWEEEGRELYAWGDGRLLVKNRRAVIDGVAQRLDALRRALLGSLVTTLEVIVVPADLALRLVTPPGGVLGDAGRRRLDQALASRAAHRLHGARLTSPSGVRRFVKSGRTTSYLQDYEIEIATASEVPNPVIQLAFSGVVMDLRATLSSDLSAVHVALRVDRTHLEEPVRSIETPHGSLDLPTLRLLRLRSGFALPLGQTAIVGAAGDAERRVLLLLTIDRIPCEPEASPPSSARSR